MASAYPMCASESQRVPPPSSLPPSRTPTDVQFARRAQSLGRANNLVSRLVHRDAHKFASLGGGKEKKAKQKSRGGFLAQL